MTRGDSSRSRIWTGFICLTCTLCAASAAAAQPAPMDEYRRITENSRALTVTLELDQAEYLPGENICVKISVANRTARPLEVFAPFKTRHQTRLSLFGYRGSPDRPAGMEWEPLSRPEPAFGDNTIAAKLKIHKQIMLLPAEEIRARSRFRSWSAIRPRWAENHDRQSSHLGPLGEVPI